MVSTAPELERTRSAILAAIPDMGDNTSPAALIEYLMKRGLPEEAVRAVLWYLIDEKELELTLDWMVRQRNHRAHD
jgi:hypothetical protein